MQIDPHCPNLGEADAGRLILPADRRQLNLPSTHRIGLELPEQQRFELPKLLEAGEAKLSLLHEAKRLVPMPPAILANALHQILEISFSLLSDCAFEHSSWDTAYQLE
jgi:hypothetical protein